jgi:hypothetical protein
MMVGPGPARVVRVFAVRRLLRPQGVAPVTEGSDPYLSMETVLTAVDTGLAVAAEQSALDAGGAGEKAIVRYHEDSGLLFVAGTHTQLKVVEEVIGNLERQAAEARGGPAQPPQAAEDKKKGTTTR